MNDDRDPREELQELVRHTRAWVAWLRDSGLDEAPVSTDPAQLLRAPTGAARPRRARRQERPAPASPAAAPAARVAAPPTAATAPPAPAPVAASEAHTQDDSAERRRRLAVLADEVSRCTKCRLHESRTNTAFARGNPDGDIVFIGEGPGFDEDQQGIPFVGKAGQLLDKMIAAMGYDRDDVYVANIVKCRPPKNRKPEPDEVEACAPYLEEQLSLVRPKVMVALGATGVQGLIGTSIGITRMRGQWKLYKGRIPLMPTFHPAYLLRQPAKKREVWNDLKQVMKRLGKSPPSKPSQEKGG